jgi:hypothetical protein
MVEHKTCFDYAVGTSRSTPRSQLATMKSTAKGCSTYGLIERNSCQPDVEVARAFVGEISVRIANSSLNTLECFQPGQSFHDHTFGEPRRRPPPHDLILRKHFGSDEVVGVRAGIVK